MRKTDKFQFVEQNKRTPTEKSVGVIFVFGIAIMLFRTVGDAGPYKEKSNILMRTTLLRGVFCFPQECG